MSQAATAEIAAIAPEDRSTRKFRVASVLGTTVFVSLLCLIVLTAIPYGTSQPWWIAAFVALIFALAILWLVEGAISQAWLPDSWPLVLPLAALSLFSFLQTLPVGKQGSSPGGIRFSPWNAISADPYQTRFFAMLLLALTLSGVLLARYAASERRLRILINVVIGVAVASAIFGIVRQTMQHGPAFGFAPDVGYGQFINKNHFAYLMEMSFGLILGLILGGGIKRDRALIYFAALLPLWIGLVLCGSRGGLVAMMAQLLVAALLFTVVARRGKSTQPQARIVRLSRSLPVRVVLILVLVVGVLFGTIWLGGDQLATRIEESRNEISTDTMGLRQLRTKHPERIQPSHR